MKFEVEIDTALFKQVLDKKAQDVAVSFASSYANKYEVEKELRKTCETYLKSEIERVLGDKNAIQAMIDDELRKLIKAKIISAERRQRKQRTVVEDEIDLLVIGGQ